MKKFCLLAIAALSAAPAPAETAREVQSLHVGYSDLDLRSHEAQAKLQRRIRSAVAAACGTASNSDLQGMNAARRCRTGNFKAASAQLRRADAPQESATSATTKLVRNGGGRR